MDYMFANNAKLVYINLENMNDYNLKSIVNIFHGTIKNMVFCIDKQNATKFNKQIEKKSCSIVYCSSDWEKKRNKIDAETNGCIKGDCSEIYKFFYNYYCIEYCPSGFIPHNYKCVDNQTSIDDIDNTKNYNNSDNITINDNEIDSDIKCKKIPYWFMKQNHKKFGEFNNDKKQKFIEAIKNCLIKRKLYELAIMAVKEKEIFTINTLTEAIQIYSLTNKIRSGNLIYVDFDQFVMLLNKSRGLKKLDEVIVLKMEYISNDIKMPIIEYLLFGQKGRT
jgi:cupin superfamily acireductone dioxygenase involved in methionine salvage